MGYSYRKRLAGALAAIMIISASAVSEVTASSSGTGGGTGSMAGLLSDVFNVIVPTQPDLSVTQNNPYKSPLNFILDPKRLTPSASTDKTFEDGATIFFRNKETGAAYDYSSTSDGFTIINKSTTQIDVILEASLSGMDGVKLTNNSTFVDDKSASVYLALIDDKNKYAAIDKFGAALKTTLDGQKDAYEVEYDKTTQKFSYALKDDAVLESEGIKFPNYTFRLTGACNLSNSWNNLSNAITPTITVTWRVALRPKNVAPSILKTSYVMNTGSSLLVGVDFGSGSQGSTGIKAITFVNGNGVTKTVPVENYSITDNELVFTASYIKQLVDSGVQSRTFTVAFNDKAETRKKVTLFANDAPPDIDQTKYTLTNGQPIRVDVDLGSGTLAASDIQSIKFINSNGVLKELSTGKYTFVNSVLEFRASFISELIKNGLVSRDYTITFNDKAKTEKIVTLSVDGVAPSIEMAEYTVKRGEAAVITVDWGSDALTANGIRSITFVNGNGVTKTVPADSYTVTGNELTFKASYITELLSTGRISREYTVTFDNVAGTQKKVTLLAESKAPEIAKTEYTMSNGNPVSVAVDLGSGALGATGVESITFISKSGVNKTLSVDNYVLTGDAIEFKSSYITTMISDGILSRDFVITLNDKNKTSETVTFSADGEVPSITQKSYVLSNGTPVTVDAAMGKGELAATGISSIEFVNSAGTLKTLPIENYTFSGNTLTFKESYVTTLLKGGLISREYTITFNNVTKTQEKIVLTAPSAPPSINTKQYSIAKDQPLRIDVDLGSGTLAATGIISVTYNSAGSEITVPSSYYVFNDGVLKLRANYINGVLSGGTLPRDYVVTFNDEAKTQATITLKK